jgi:hypothetical protein
MVIETNACRVAGVQQQACNNRSAKRPRVDEASEDHAPAPQPTATNQVCHKHHNVRFDTHISNSLSRGRSRTRKAARNPKIKPQTSSVETKAEKAMFMALYEKFSGSTWTDWTGMCEVFNRAAKMQTTVTDSSEVIGYKTNKQLQNYEQKLAQEMRQRNACLHIAPRDQVHVTLNSGHL